MLQAYIQDRGKSERLILQNDGPGEVRDLQVQLDGDPITEHPIIPEGPSLGNEISVMAEGSQVSYLLTRSMDSPPAPYEIEIKYQDDEGVEQVFRDTVTKI